MRSPNTPCPGSRSGPSYCPRAVLRQMVEGDLEPAHPIAVTFPASSEAIDALPGTQRGAPRVVPDETKLAITNCASRGPGRSNTFGEVGHCCLGSIAVVRRSSISHRRTCKPVRFSDPCSLGRSQSTTQLHEGNHPAPEGFTGPIPRFIALTLEAETLSQWAI